MSELLLLPQIQVTEFEADKAPLKKALSTEQLSESEDDHDKDADSDADWDFTSNSENSSTDDADNTDQDSVTRNIVR